MSRFILRTFTRCSRHTCLFQRTTANSPEPFAPFSGVPSLPGVPRCEITLTRMGHPARIRTHTRSTGALTIPAFAAAPLSCACRLRSARLCTAQVARQSDEAAAHPISCVCSFMSRRKNAGLGFPQIGQARYEPIRIQAADVLSVLLLLIKKISPTTPVGSPVCLWITAVQINKRLRRKYLQRKNRIETCRSVVGSGVSGTARMSSGETSSLFR